MELTLREAIIKGRDMWQWLADNPRHTKLDYFRYKKIEETPLNDCYACEIVGARKETPLGCRCKECFLLPLWFGVRSKIPEDLKHFLRSNTPCEDSEKSPYRKWRRGQKLNIKRKEALKIAKYHDKLLKKMEIG